MPVRREGRFAYHGSVAAAYRRWTLGFADQRQTRNARGLNFPEWRGEHFEHQGWTRPMHLNLKYLVQLHRVELRESAGPC